MSQRPEVVVVDVNIAFAPLVVLMLKVVIAAVPALITLYVLAYLAWIPVMAILGLVG